MNQKGNKIQTRASFESFICNCVKILPVWIRQKRNMIKMKSWFLAHNLCWIPTFFPMKYTKLLQINLSCFTSKYFFHCWSKKRETISKWELVLRLSFVIMSYLTSYDFFQSFILVFLVRIFYLFKKNKKRTRSKWRAGCEYMTYVKYLHIFHLIETQGLSNHFFMIFTSKYSLISNHTRRKQDQD